MKQKTHRIKTSTLFLGGVLGLIIGSFIPDPYSPLALIKKARRKNKKL